MSTKPSLCFKIIEHQLSAEGKVFVGRKCDVTQETSVCNEIAWIEKTYGKLNVVVNNAGIGRVATLTGKHSIK